MRQCKIIVSFWTENCVSNRSTPLKIYEAVKNNSIFWTEKCISTRSTPLKIHEAIKNNSIVFD